MTEQNNHYRPRILLATAMLCATLLIIGGAAIGTWVTIQNKQLSQDKQLRQLAIECSNLYSGEKSPGCQP